MHTAKGRSKSLCPILSRAIVYSHLSPARRRHRVCDPYSPPERLTTGLSLDIEKRFISASHIRPGKGGGRKKRLPHKSRASDRLSDYDARELEVLRPRTRWTRRSESVSARTVQAKSSNRKSCVGEKHRGIMEKCGLVYVVD